MMLDLSDRTVVIVGGGAVGARKARGCLDAGAVVRCVSPAFTDQLPDGVVRVRGLYESSHLDGAVLVFAATDQPEINSDVVRDARSRSILVCRADADELEPGDFSTPAMHIAGSLAITVSAGNPALSAAIRTMLADRIDPAWIEMSELMQSLRPRIKSLGLAIEARRRIFRDLASAQAISTMRVDGRDAVIRWLASRYPELNHA